MRADTTTVTIDAPAVLKVIASTSLAATPEGSADTAPDPRLVAVGETVRMRLRAQLPEGGSTGVSVTDQLPAGYTYVAGSARIALISDTLSIGRHRRSSAAAARCSKQATTPTWLS